MWKYGVSMTASIWKACKLSLSCLSTFSVALKLPPSGSKLPPCELKLPPCRTHFRILTYMEEVNFLYVRTTKKKHWLQTLLLRLVRTRRNARRNAPRSSTTTSSSGWNHSILVVRVDPDVAVQTSQDPVDELQ